MLLTSSGHAQDSLRIRRAGPGRAGTIVREAAAAPHRVLVADTGRITLPRGSVIETSLLVVGGDVAVGGRVAGDVVVVGGNLFMHPGGAIDGRAIALGGCVYTSTLATIAGEIECDRDARFEVRRTPPFIDVAYVEPREEDLPALALPFPAGLRIPTYTRVEGLGLPWGPRLRLFQGRLDIDPTVTYRSATGALDPQLRLTVGAGTLWFVEAELGRGTRTNDAWIRDDLLNSVLALFAGRDVRNYYRSRYAVARGGRRWERGATLLSAWFGGQAERDRSTHARAPWSAFDRRDSVEGLARPNPAVAHGDLGSLLAGVGLSWESAGVELTSRLETEVVLDAPGDASFAQTTGHAAIAFPTFGTQRLTFEAHAVFTGGDPAVAQRFAYLGGSGTLPTRDLLSMGGDQLVFLESRYEIPIDRLQIPFSGPPVVVLRHVMGSAGVDSLPDLVQNIGARLTIRPLRFDVAHDPASGDSEFKVGVSFGR
jgi:hypothetical protein